MPFRQTAILHDPALFSMNIGQLSAVVELDRDFTADEVVAAVARLCEVFPILGCRYHRSFWRDRWQWAGTPTHQLVRVAASSHPLSDQLEAISENIDVLSGSPLRVTLLKTGGRSSLVLNMPHQVVDGNGLLTTLHELACQLTGNGRAGPVAMNRSFLQLFGAIKPRQWPAVLAETVRDAVTFARMLGVTPWTSTFSSERAAGQIRAQRVSFSEKISTSFHEACREKGATVNDGLLAQALGVAAHFSNGEHIGAAYTINLRKFLGNDTPIIGNMSGFLMLSLSRALALQPRLALDLVRQATGEHKKGLPGVGSNLFPVPFLGWLPHGLLRPAALPIGKGFRTMGTRVAVMTNVGSMDPFLAPFGKTALDAWMTAPSIPGFPGPISLATSFKNRLSVCVGGPDSLAVRDIAAVAAAWQTGVTEFAVGAPTHKIPVIV